MEIKKLTAEQIAMLQESLPAKALKQHPTKAFLTTINSIYVTERLNDVFGVGAWQIRPEIIEAHDKMIVVKTTLTIPEYGIYYECYGGNDNPDRGDAYKGAVTDAITKIGSWMGIGAEVWKNEVGKTAPKAQAQPAQEKPKLSIEQAKTMGKQIAEWLISSCKISDIAEAEKTITNTYDCDYATTCYLRDCFKEHSTTK